jgi:DNA-3-methyladenine glycosylase I
VHFTSSRNAISFLTDPLYSSFHDEEWGVPVIDDDRKLFELLVYSQALAEHTWPAILNNRDIFRHFSISIDMSLYI